MRSGIRDRAEKADKELDKMAEKFRTSASTPLDKFIGDLEKIRDLELIGKLLPDEATSAIAAARKTAADGLMADLKENEKKNKGEFNLNAAKEFGSAAAASAIAAGVTQRETPEQKELRRQTQLQVEIKAAIDAALLKLQPNQPVDIPAA
jgi:hypothetical protein